MLFELKRTRDLHVFAYDWRRSTDETVDKFEVFLEDVKSNTGMSPQVIAHSMGGIISLSLLNRRPELFHSVLFGAAAYGRSMAILEDVSLPRRQNAIGRSKMFTPETQLTMPSAWNMMASTGQQTLWGEKAPILLSDQDGNPIKFDLHELETWKRLKLGMYHPESGVKVDKNKEKWFQSVLAKCLAFRKTLTPHTSNGKDYYPPVAVIRGNHMETNLAFVMGKNGLVDFDNAITQPGDGRITLENALPPKGIPVVKVITNDRDHSNVLNDLEGVNELLSLLIEEREQVCIA